MAFSGIYSVKMAGPDARLVAIEGAIFTKEWALLIDRARIFFTKRLGSALRLNYPVGYLVRGPKHVEVNGERFDYAIDATWGHHHLLPINVYYEPISENLP